MKRKILSWFIMVMAVPPAFGEEEFRVAWPVACELGKDCFIQNYVDRDPSKMMVDYTCSRMTYDGHKGTDIRIANLARMREGVKVLAAAEGVVRGVRDGVEDVYFGDADKKTVQNRECGNGVVLRHPGGIETQYCHLRKGSIAVKQGEEVKTGQVLGLIGLSGFTEFPHVHFEVRRGKTIIDPFVGETKQTGCHVERHPIWTRDALETISHIPTAVLASGFAVEKVTAPEARDGKYNEKTFRPDAPLIMFWVDVMGILPGDRIELEIKFPDGKSLVDHHQNYDKGKAQIFHFLGKKREEEAWPKGTYTASFTLKRKKGGEYQISIFHTDKMEVK
ncbi:MAG: M23 family metallopeptidase [Alphaproteobacteria bacterium]|nr:M23 family metallopeptidase [Alphaproteobacteria bacterium]